jgi:OOP family OmpA-OmpF porin
MNRLVPVSFWLCIATLASSAEVEAEPLGLNFCGRVLSATYQSLELPGVTTLGAVLFRSDSAEIEQALWPVLRGAISLAMQYPEIVIDLEGHADVHGSRNHNRQLSLERVQAVTEFLVHRGISPDRIRMRAYGESRAGANVNDDQRHIFDRRVTVTLNTADTSA